MDKISYFDDFLYVKFVCFFSSPQFSPYCEPPSPWVNVSEASGEGMDPAANVPTTYNQRSSEKMKADEALGLSATISAVLYANTNQPEWKTEFPVWSDRYKQIIKKWRTLSNEAKAPFLQRAKDNRSAQRMKKAQQVCCIFTIRFRFRQFAERVDHANVL